MAADSERRARAAQIAAQPYAFVLVHDDESGAWTTTVLEFPGVIAEGDSPGEAIASGREAVEEMVDYYLEDGRTVPEPFQTREFSGRTELRLNPETHRRAVMLAANEGVSLNRWLSAAVASYTQEAPATAPDVVHERPRLVAEEQGGYDDASPAD